MAIARLQQITFRVSQRLIQSLFQQYRSDNK